MKYKDFKYRIEDVDEKGTVVMYVSAFGNKDSDGDIIQKGAYKKTIKEGMQRIKHLKDHNRFMLLGLPKEMEEDSTGLKVKSVINIKKELGRETYEDYKFFAEHNRTLEHSVGIDILKADDNILTELKLWEYSTLSFLGANSETPLLDIKSHKDIGETITMLENMLKGQYSDEKLLQIEQKIKELNTLINEPSDDTNELEPLIDKWYKLFN